MSAVTIQQMADRVAEMMEERLRLTGDGLAAKLRKGGRLMPRRVRHAAQSLADAAERAQNPKLLVQIDMGKVASDYDICIHHLSTVTRRGGWRLLLLNATATLAAGLLVMAGIGLYLYYRHITG